jgi:putative SOS response-associated peptidase YedK
MPVVLAEDWAKWLEVPATNDELKALLIPFKDDALTVAGQQTEDRQRSEQGPQFAAPEPLQAVRQLNSKLAR